jgi:hypothetical protein
VLRTDRIGFIIEIVLGRFRLVSGCPGGRVKLWELTLRRSPIIDSTVQNRQDFPEDGGHWELAPKRSPVGVCCQLVLIVPVGELGAIASAIAF